MGPPDSPSHGAIIGQVDDLDHEAVTSHAKDLTQGECYHVEEAREILESGVIGGLMFDRDHQMRFSNYKALV